MKQIVSYENESDFIRDFITQWKTRKGYLQDPVLSFGECLELKIAVSHDLFTDDSDGRFFNRALIGNEFTLLWEGDEPLDILFYEVIQDIKQLLASGRMFNETEIT